MSSAILRDSQKSPLLALLLWLAVATSASATPMSIQAIYNSPGGGSVTVTGIYDDAGFTGIGLESFDFTSAVFEFSADSGLLANTTHNTTDWFGVVLSDGVGLDLYNRNNTEANGKSKLVFQNAATTQGFGIYMSDTSSQLYVEPWTVVNHQNPERHFLNSFGAPTVVPEPGTSVLLMAGLAGLAFEAKRRRPASRCALRAARR